MDDFPDLPLDNFGADTAVAAAPPAVEPQTAPEPPATGLEASQVAQPVPAEDNSITEDVTDEQGPVDAAGRPEKRDRVQNRFDDLTRKIYEKDQYIQQLERQTAQFDAMKGVQPLTPDENGMIDPQALQRNIAETARAQASAETSILRNQLDRERVAQQFDHEGQQIEATLQQLNATPEMREAVEEAVKAAIEPRLYSVESLKQVSPLQIASKIIKGFEAAGRISQAQAQANLQALKASSAVEPGNTASSVDQDSMEALEARVADMTF